MLSQRDLVLIAVIIHDRQAFNVSLTPSYELSSHVGILFAYVGQASWAYTAPGTGPASKALPYQKVEWSPKGHQ